ncbi:AAA family ATPase [Sorangium sp. So ce1024]|uniref:AAA family ATPase n=1 Tax=Sorangium sp. So ce1024 TaxID=3133327 RepID=UPI003F0543F0
MVKLKRLKIHRYRNVEPCELIFGDRRNILLGPNGAGKTTLLSLISKVLRTSLSDPGDPFSIEIELTLPRGSLTGTIASREPRIDPAEFLRLPPMARVDAYTASEVPDINLVLSVADSQTTISFRRSDDRLIIQGGGLDNGLPAGIITTSVGTLNLVLNLTSNPNTGPHIDSPTELKNASRFDESLDTFRALTARQDVADLQDGDLRPEICLTQTQSPDNGSSHQRIVGISAHGIVPENILNILGRLDLPAATIEHSIHHDQLHFLSETVRLLGLSSATAMLELLDKRVYQSTNKATKTEQLDFGNLKFWFTRRDGSIFQDQHLSYGQKRLLAFLYYLDANPSFVIADELVNGLHHAWIEECMNAIGDRQAFLTSQNPLLLDYLSFESVEQVKESFILCRNQVDGDRERMIWRNMTDDEADMFYRAYQVGIEHVGEILRTRGLW